MKEYSCCQGHQFNSSEVMHKWNDMPMCPYCYGEDYGKTLRESEDNIIRDILSSSKICQKCIDLFEWFNQEHPEKKGKIICEECYEKHYVHLKLDYDPYRGLPDFPTSLKSNE